jgi:hypothetical protein
MRAEVRGHWRGAPGPDGVPVRSGASRPQVVNPLPCVSAMAEPAARIGVIMHPVAGAAHVPAAAHVVGLGTGKTVNYS